MNGGLVSKSNSTIGIKEYELNDHLGNVSVVVLDRKKSLSTNIQPIIKSHTDYYPFGYPISFRTHSSGYRYGFNGQEGDNEIYGIDKCYSYEYRNYDSRIGRWWSVDELKNQQPSQSTYKAFYNNPILFVDNDGLIEYVTVVFISNKGAVLTYRMEISFNIMTDGIKYEVRSKISDAVWSYENRYYDYEHIITFIQNADGSFIQKGPPVTRIMTESDYKADGVYFGGNKKGETRFDYTDYLYYLSFSKPWNGFNLVSDEGGPSPTTKKGNPDVTTVNITNIMAAFNAMSKTPGKLPDLKNDPSSYPDLVNLIKDMVEIINSKNPKKPPIVHQCANCGNKFDENFKLIITNQIPTDTIGAEDHENK